MRLEAYAAFTEALRARLESDPRVLGLVALGSMARHDYEPDQWSDHDFFVITIPGAQGAFRTDRSWLPDPERVVFSYPETAHGIKALYDDGHLVEFAVFDLDELNVARVNRYRVLLDRGDVEQRMADLADSTAAATEARADGGWLVGQFLTGILVAAGRFARGERASARSLITNQAARTLLVLLARHIPSERRDVLDDLDPFRRFEVAYPDLGRELDVVLRLETLAAALGLLDLGRRELEGRMPGFPSRAAEIVRRRLAEL
jgi:hypothetical protein